MFAIYAYKNEQDDHLFVERSLLIKRMKPYEVMVYLGIREKFLLGEASMRASYLENSKYGSNPTLTIGGSSPYSEQNHT